MPLDEQWIPWEEQQMQGAAKPLEAANAMRGAVYLLIGAAIALRAAWAALGAGGHEISSWDHDRQGSSKGHETEVIIRVAKPMRGAAETGREQQTPHESRKRRIEIIRGTGEFRRGACNKWSCKLYLECSRSILRRNQKSPLDVLN